MRACLPDNAAAPLSRNSKKAKAKKKKKSSSFPWHWCFCMFVLAGRPSGKTEHFTRNVLYVLLQGFIVYEEPCRTLLKKYVWEQQEGKKNPSTEMTVCKTEVNIVILQSFLQWHSMSHLSWSGKYSSEGGRRGQTTVHRFQLEREVNVVKDFRYCIHQWQRHVRCVLQA